jgi:hypothetical protein
MRDDDAEALRFGETELDNAGVALAYAIATRSGVDAAHLLWGTFKAWGSFGRAREGARWAEAALEAKLSVDGIPRLCLLLGAADILHRTAGQDLDRARGVYEEALSIATRDIAVDARLPGGRTLRSLVISVQSTLSEVATRNGSMADARLYADAALAAARAADEPHGLTRALDTAAAIAFVSGDFSTALAAAGEKVAVDTELGRIADASDALTLVAHCQLELGRDDAAAEALSAAIERIRLHPTRHAYLNNVFFAAAAIAVTRSERGLASGFLRLALRVTADTALVLDSERVPVAAQLQRAVAGTEPLVDFASEDDALDHALELARRVSASAISAS